MMFPLCAAWFGIVLGTTTPAAATHKTTTPGFVRNDGQWDPRIRFGAIGDAYVVRVLEDGFELARPQEAVRFRIESAAPTLDCEPTGERQLRARSHYFYGNDPSLWRTDVPAFGRVVLPDAAPGVDVVLTMIEGDLHYDLLVDEGADETALVLRCEGMAPLSVGADGTLRATTKSGEIVHRAPRAYAIDSLGARSEVTSTFEVLDPSRFRLRAASVRTGDALIVDPGLTWSTFLGGSIPAPSSGLNQAAFNTPRVVKVRSNGATLVCGFTGRIDFPTTPNAIDPTYSGGTSDGFIAELSPDGTDLEFSTFVGGISAEGLLAMDVLANGEVVCAGVTTSPNFPLTPGGPFGTSPTGQFPEVVVVRFTPDGSSIVYSVLIPGGSPEVGALACLPNTDVVIVGNAAFSSFPTTPGAFDTVHGGNWDGFVTRLKADGQALVYSTFLGGAQNDWLRTAERVSDGSVVVGGRTTSGGYPTTPGVFQPTKSVGTETEGVLTRLASDGSSLVYSTFFGGNGGEYILGLALDPHDQPTIAGPTSSNNLPITPGAFQDCCGGNDSFVARLTADGAGLVFCTYFGGVGSDEIRACRVDAAGNVTFCGYTFSDHLQGFPTTKGAFKESFSVGPTDGFVARLSSHGRELLYSTLIGGSAPDFSGASNFIGLDLDPAGGATISGVVSSADYPVTPGAFDEDFGPLGKAAVTRLDMLPKGCTAFGASTHGCSGPLAISVGSMPFVGNADFALRCVGAPPLSSGFLLLSGSALATPLLVAGVPIFADPAAGILVPVVSAENGECRVEQGLRSTDVPIGTKGYAQFFFPDSCATTGLASSNALEIIVQPN
jgi:hypothetical protein